MKERKRILLIIILGVLLTLLAIRMRAQTGDLKQAFKDYISYCNETVADTIKQTGTVQLNDIPIYDGEMIVAYKRASGDTLWKAIKCPLYKEDFDNPYWGRSLICDSLSISSYYDRSIYWNLAPKDNYVKTVTRDHICYIQRENPSQAGFYKWLFFRLH